MPHPSSVMRINAVPPRSISIKISAAPASREFSMSSFTTLAGRSTTSPAATWLARMSGKTWMRGMVAIP
jgi:hypothetical protein